MACVYARFGLEPLINAKGPGTRLSGGIARPEVRAAMVDAMAHCVDIVELHARASAVIARHTGAESGLVTSGGPAAGHGCLHHRARPRRHGPPAPYSRGVREHRHGALAAQPVRPRAPDHGPRGG